MFNKVANKQQSGLQCPANGKPNDGNFYEGGGDDDDNGDDIDGNGDEKMMVKMMFVRVMMMVTKDWGELMIHSSDIWR